jgi:RHS repeat-associated protein
LVQDGGVYTYGANDATRQRFTGKERDAESNLDYFLARYYSGSQGRFTSPDPQNAGAIPEDPQSWNAYAYARNNPLLFTDPTGTKYRLCDNSGHCVDNYSDSDFERNFKNDAAVTLDYTMGMIYVGGKVIGTFEHLNFDSFTPFQQGVFEAMSARREATKGLIANLAAESVASGVSGFAIGKAVQAYVAYRGAQALASEVESLVLQAAQTAGNKGIVASSKEAALAAAERWVGVGARPIYNAGQVVGKISADGQRVYRITSINKPQPYVNLFNRATGGNLHVRF